MAKSTAKSLSSTKGETIAGVALAHVLESTSDCVMTFDQEWRFTFLNARATAEIGAAETLLGQGVLDAYPRLEETPFWREYQVAKRTGQPRRVEAYMPGLESWYEACAAPTEDGMTIFFRNIDARKKAEQAAAERETQFTKILDHLPQMIWSTSADGYHDYYNRLWYDFTGVSSGSTDGDGWNDMFHPDDRDRALTLWHQSLETGDPYEIEYRLRHRSGDYRWVLRRAWPERNVAGEIVRWYGTCTDIHECISAQAALRTSETLQQSVLDASADCIKVLGTDGTLEFMNAPGCRAMDLDDFEAIRGKPWASLWPSDGRGLAEKAVNEACEGFASRFTGYCPTAKGLPKWWDVLVSPMLNDAGVIGGLLCISRDITALREKSDQLKWESEHDALTSLPNRRAFQSHLQAALIRAMQTGRSVGLLVLDLDHFKHVNDTMGHGAGDLLLQTFAQRIRSSVRKSDFAARLGGDEFAVILEEIEQEKELVDSGASILARLQGPISLDGRVFSGNASIGGAMFPRDAENGHDLLKNADTALYALKAAGRGGTKLFHHHMREEAQRVASQISLARVVVKEESIIPFYQPKVNLRTGAVVGFEALLRWQHPTRGMQLPDTVEEAFKDYDLASKIGELVQNKVFAHIAGCAQRGIRLGCISLNAAPSEFLRDDYAERFLSRVNALSLAPSMLEVEVTEHVFLGRTSELVARALHKLKAAGVRIALDDFGTGHSSLSHLRDFPVDVVKIDRSFVAEIGANDEVTSIVRAVIDLGRSLGLEVVAEGVETAEQLALLKVMGCDLGQGWFFGRAVEAVEMGRVVGLAA